MHAICSLLYIVQGKGTDQDEMVGVIDFDGREGDRRSGDAKIAGEKVMAVLFSTTLQQINL